MEFPLIKHDMHQVTASSKSSSSSTLQAMRSRGRHGWDPIKFCVKKQDHKIAHKSLNMFVPTPISIPFPSHFPSHVPIFSHIFPMVSMAFPRIFPPPNPNPLRWRSANARVTAGDRTDSYGDVNISTTILTLYIYIPYI